LGAEKIDRLLTPVVNGYVAFDTTIRKNVWPQDKNFGGRPKDLLALTDQIE
jgi:hypothetical protein